MSMVLHNSVYKCPAIGFSPAFSGVSRSAAHSARDCYPGTSVRDGALSHNRCDRMESGTRSTVIPQKPLRRENFLKVASNANLILYAVQVRFNYIAFTVEGHQQRSGNHPGNDQSTTMREVRSKIFSSFAWIRTPVLYKANRNAATLTLTAATLRHSCISVY